MRLADVAKVSLQPSPNAIDREGDSRRLDVSATFEGDLGGVVGQLEQKLKDVKFEQGYHAEILGEWQERESAQRTLLVTAVVAGAAILLLLQASFGSWRLALLSFLTLPMALVGGVIGAFLGGGVVSLGSLVGFFTVFGIAARNGILLINHFQHLEREEGMTFGRDLVVRGARERLSPILMTSLATGLALIPLVIFGERPGQEIEHPLAIVILGGLVTSTLAQPVRHPVALPALRADPVRETAMPEPGPILCHQPRRSLSRPRDRPEPVEGKSDRRALVGFSHVATNPQVRQAYRQTRPGGGNSDVV